MAKAKPKRKKTPVRSALQEESALQELVQDGLGAMGRDRKYLETAIRGAFLDSLDLDRALAKDLPQEHRWDYLLGHDPSKRVVAVEPHTATTHEVAVVIRKRAEALNQLREHLQDGVHIAKWLWVASGRIDIIEIEKARLRLDQNGIELVGRQVQARHLPAGKTKACGKS